MPTGNSHLVEKLFYILEPSPLHTQQCVATRLFFQVVCVVTTYTILHLLAMLTLFTPLYSSQLKSCYSNVVSSSTNSPCDLAANVSTCCRGNSYCATKFLSYRCGRWLGCSDVCRYPVARSRMSPPTTFDLAALCTRKPI